MAYDLTKSSDRRMPISSHNPFAEQDTDFTVLLWVKGEPESEAAYDIVSVLHHDGEAACGWNIGVQANGAWCWTAHNNKVRYDYVPTAKRQTIRDGQWHMLAFVCNAEHTEARLYYDGVSVAIYSVEGLTGFNQAGQVWIGGTPHEDQDEWHAFNGLLDEISWFDRRLTADEIWSHYAAYRTDVQKATYETVSSFKAMTFNIWHGGNRTGKEVGILRTIDLIRESGADIIAMQETYGSGARIADALGYYFYLRSSNLSIMSRFPIAETIPVFRAFNSGGVKIVLGSGQQLYFFNLWLHYLPDVWSSLLHDERLSEQEIIEGERETRWGEIKQILSEIQPFTDGTDKIPVLVCGDFNNGSYLDWTEEAAHRNNGYVVNWPVSKEMADAGYRDSYRAVHPDPVNDPGLSWSPVY